MRSYLTYMTMKLILGLLLAAHMYEAAVIHLEFDTEQLLEDLERLEQDSDFVNALQTMYHKKQQTQQTSFSWPPPFCQKLECPKYKLVESNTEYEVRHYAAASWVSTNTSDVAFERAASTLYTRLLDYISGNNSRDEKLPGAVPVLLRITPGQGPACASNFTGSFYLPPSVTHPPKPRDPTVYISEMPASTVYVRSFGGVPTLNDYTREGHALASALPETAKYISSNFYIANYNAPVNFLNRHNEVWFKGTD